MSGSLSFASTVRFSTSTSHGRPMHSRPRFTIMSLASSAVGTRKAANLYEVLRVKKTASPIEIKTAYRSLAKRFHPDAGSDGRDFMEIHEAYATLSDPTARALYDHSIGSMRQFVEFAENRFRTRRWETDQCW
ncbi:hypothetical protein AAC387_Pa07g1526 [Persea americana]